MDSPKEPHPELRTQFEIDLLHQAQGMSAGAVVYSRTL